MLASVVLPVSSYARALPRTSGQVEVGVRERLGGEVVATPAASGAVKT